MEYAMKRRYFKTLAFGLALACALPVAAQNKVVQGTVVDEHGDPIIGATVRVAGTKTATVTDLDGTMRRVSVKVMPHVFGSSRIREKSFCRASGTSP